MNPCTLTLSQATRIAPAIAAIAPDPKVSPNYQFVRTQDIIEAMLAQDWVITNVVSRRSRNGHDKAKHMVSMIPMHFAGNVPTINGHRLFSPSLTVINSHDWSSRLRIMIGMYVLVCSNGLMIQSDVDTLSVRHDNITHDLQELIAHAMQLWAAKAELARIMSEIMLTPDELAEYNLTAYRIRFGDDATPKEPAELLFPSHRPLEQNPTLWNTFQRAQEHLIRGGVVRTITGRRARAIRNVDALTDVNTRLWDLSEEWTQD